MRPSAAWLCGVRGRITRESNIISVIRSLAAVFVLVTAVCIVCMCTGVHSVGFGPVAPVIGCMGIRSDPGWWPVAEHPGAVLVPGGDVVVAAASLADLLAVLRSHREVCRSASAPVPRWTPGLHQVTRVIAEGAAAHQRRRLSAAVVPVSLVMSGSGCSAGSGAPSGSGEVVSVAAAAQIMGVSPRYIRVLAASGGIPALRSRCRFPGQRSTRVQWVVDAGACHAHRLERELLA